MILEWKEGKTRFYETAGNGKYWLSTCFVFGKPIYQTWYKRENAMALPLAIHETKEIVKEKAQIHADGMRREAALNMAASTLDKTVGG